MTEPSLAERVAERQPLTDAYDLPNPGLADDECAGICMT